MQKDESLQTTKKIHIETYGCQMNVADSEVVAAIMETAGYEMSDSPDDADAILINTCSVRENAEKKFSTDLSITINSVVNMANPL